MMCYYLNVQFQGQRVNGEQSRDLIEEVLAVFGILIIISYHDIHCYTVDPNNVMT